MVSLEDSELVIFKMAKISCFSLIVGKKKKVKGDDESSRAGEMDKAIRTLHIRLQQQPVKPVEVNGLKPMKTFGAFIPYGVDKEPIKDDKVKTPDSPVGLCEAAYEAEDEHEESPNNNFNGFDLQAIEVTAAKEVSFRKMDFCESDKESGRGADRIQSGHLSDPGIGKAEFWGSPKLTRSCSNLETHNVDEMMPSKLPLSKTRPFEELQELAESVRKDVNPGSPASVRSHFSADKVMLKKHSSSQVLPSRSRRLWWKLFLWSHRNLHTSSSTATPKKLSIKTNLNKQGGYSSDTLEPNRAMQIEKMESPVSDKPLNKGKNIMNDNQSWGGFHTGASSLWPQNQWVAFSTEASSSSRVVEWVKDLNTTPSSLLPNEDENEEIVTPRTPPSPETAGGSSTYFTRGPNANLSEDTLHANTIIQTLNSSSTVAHISGMGIKAIPNISCFCSLRSVNLSNNFIVHITPGSLPKSLHTLDLSKNKISSIEGLRELTRLRVLDFSYNRISRIGRGLSSCSKLKELYLAGNKIGDVEGLHRLLKLTVLDLSFNKITTTKALGQLVANYNSLQGLNLLGNPIQNNIGDEQLRKTIVSLLPKLVFLNKQAITPQRAREAVTDSVAKAALGKSGWNPHRKTGKKLTQSLSFPRKRSDSISPKKTQSFPNRGHKSGAIASVGQKSMSKSKSLAKV